MTSYCCDEWAAIWYFFQIQANAFADICADFCRIIFWCDSTPAALRMWQENHWWSFYFLLQKVNSGTSIISEHSATNNVYFNFLYSCAMSILSFYRGVSSPTITVFNTLDQITSSHQRLVVTISFGNVAEALSQELYSSHWLLQEFPFVV